jgi:SAM-dependent methyltransferase
MTPLIAFKKKEVVKISRVEVSFPHEWPSGMFKKFVMDYVKNIPDGKLIPESLIIPIILFERKNHTIARKILFKVFRHPGKILLLKEQLFDDKNKDFYFKFIEKSLLYEILLEHNQNPCYSLKDKLIEAVKNTNIGAVDSIEKYYYSFRKTIKNTNFNTADSKDYSFLDEDFSFDETSLWKSKQKSVYQVLREVKPKTVLDLGANTGWYSFLAAKFGAQVVATDSDESSLELLYDIIMMQNVNITPLLIPFNRMMFNRNYLYENVERPEERLKSDVVLCLALLHHLIIGSGFLIEDVLKTLYDVTSKTLVLEFIDLNDFIIRKCPVVFQNLYRTNSKNYSLDLIINNGKKLFGNLSILESNPSETRKLLVFTK